MTSLNPISLWRTLNQTSVARSGFLLSTTSEDSPASILRRISLSPRYANRTKTTTTAAKSTTTTTTIEEAEDDSPEARLKRRNYCLNSLRKSDHENYLCALLAPEKSRRGVVAVGAFNVEVAQVRDSVKDHRIGEMRLQFWRDAVDAIYGKGTHPPRKGNPVIAELQTAVEEYGLSRAWLNRIVDARKDRISEKPFSSLSDLESYAESTSSSVHFLLLETLGVRSLEADHAVSHLGKARGIANCLRATPALARKRTVVLPTEVLVKHGATAEDFIRGSSSTPVRDVVFDVAAQAHAHLAAARSLAPQVPRQATPAFLQATFLQAYLNALDKVDFNVFDPRLSRRSPMIPFKLWINSRRNKY